MPPLAASRRSRPRVRFCTVDAELSVFSPMFAELWLLPLLFARCVTRRARVVEQPARALP